LISYFDIKDKSFEAQLNEAFLISLNADI
jgi:hypothetical protein